MIRFQKAVLLGRANSTFEEIFRSAKLVYYLVKMSDGTHNSILTQLNIFGTHFIKENLLKIC